jgi:hypothetical protein
MNPQIYMLLVQIGAMLFVCGIFWVLIKSVKITIKTLGYEAPLKQPTCIVFLYALIALAISRNLIGLSKAATYFANYSILDIESFIFYIAKSTTVIVISSVVAFFTFKKKPFGRWLAAAFIAGVFVWLSMYTNDHPPGYSSQQLFTYKNPEMGKGGEVYGRVSYFVILFLLFVNIVFSKSSKNHYEKNECE